MGMKKAVVFTLGCKVNGCESGSLARGLSERGWEVSDELVPADLYILNTCAVTGEAEKKSRQAIARIAAVSPQAPVIVCGCAAEKAPAAFADKRSVTLVTGARQKGKILELIDGFARGEGLPLAAAPELCGAQTMPASGAAGKVRIDEADQEYDELPAPVQLKTRAFVKIQDGCNNFCSYCIIPYLRGRSRSRTVESAAAEILQCNAAECVITGIDISSYRDGERGLPELLLAVRDAKSRIRLGSLEVGVVTEELLRAAKQVRDFAPQFHLSLQSGSDAVLKKMNRHYTGEEYLARVALIRKYFPDAAITTDIIAGFPTETEENFEETLSLARRAAFSQIHCFAYSRRTGTNAAKWKELPAAVKKERLHRLLALGRELREEYERAHIGKTLEMIPEEEKNGYTVGYSENYIRLYLAGGVPTGQKVRVRAVALFEDGLLAEREE